MAEQKLNSDAQRQIRKTEKKNTFSMQDSDSKFI